MMQELNRRKFLQVAIGVIGSTGATTVNAQQQLNRVNRRMVFKDSPKLSDEYQNRVIIITERSEARDPNKPPVGQCEFSEPWPPETVEVYQCLIVEWRNEDTTELFGTNPTVRAQKLIRRQHLHVERRQLPVELGMTFIIDNVIQCPNRLIGVEASQIPGIRIKTPPSNEGGVG